MNLSAALYAIRWLIWDTIWQSFASGLVWVMLTVSVVSIALCLSVGVEGDLPVTRKGPNEIPDFLPPAPPPSPAEVATAVTAPRLLGQAWLYDQFVKTPEFRRRGGVDLISGRMTVAFGAVPVRLGRDRSDAVHHIQLLLAGWVADTAGILLTLVWTAGFLPTFLEPSAAAVLLAKPVPRWSLLVGKYLGVLVFVALQALVFVGGTWLALGAKTAVWDLTYLLTIPLLLLQFAVFFSFSVLLAVCTRSTVACVVGSILFWLMSWGMNVGRHMAAEAPELKSMSPLFRFLMEAGYWIVPKPADMSALVFNALQADNYFVKALDVKSFDAELTILSSLAFTVVTLAIAGYQFVTTDY